MDLVHSHADMFRAGGGPAVVADGDGRVVGSLDAAVKAVHQRACPVMVSAVTVNFLRQARAT